MTFRNTFDYSVALIAIVLLTPIMLLTSISILICSGSPITFKQKRLGLHGKEFILYKFRSMTNSTSTNSFDAGSTLRVTKIGKILRKAKLDELPQLINVLKGEMALVGPRPEVRKWVETYPDRWKKVHTVRPGITDTASILYRNEEKILADSPNPENTYREQVLPHKLTLYEEYIKNRTFWGDIKIIFQTFFALFR